MSQEERGLLIAYLDPPDTAQGGDWYYRNHLPCRSLSLSDHVYTVNLNSVNRHWQEVANEVDVLVLRNISEIDLLPVIASRKQRRLITVFEVSDDAGAVQPWSIVYAFRSNPENHRVFLRMSLACDAVQYTVDELQRVYGYLNANGQVFANQLSPIPDALPQKSESEFIVGWGGSHGHLGDMRAASQMLSQWVMAHDDARLAIMGSGPICEIFSHVPANKKQQRGTGTIFDYYSFLDPLHVGLAPLVDDAFNRSRSDVKFLEYAAHGAVAVVQDVLPYQATVEHGKLGFRYSKEEQLVQILDELYANPGLRKEVADRAYAYVKAERRQEAHAQDRLAFYDRLLANVGHTRRSIAQCKAFADKMATWEGAKVQGRHTQLEPSKFEKLLFTGLVLLQQNQNGQDARAQFQQAEKLAPENYLASLMLAPVAADPIAALEAAARKNPRSLRAKLELGTARFTRGEVEPALAAYLSAAEVVPDFEQPYFRAAEMLAAIGAEDAANDMASRAEALCAPLWPKADK